MPLNFRCIRFLPVGHAKWLGADGLCVISCFFVSKCSVGTRCDHLLDSVQASEFPWPTSCGSSSAKAYVWNFRCLEFMLVWHVYRPMFGTSDASSSCSSGMYKHCLYAFELLFAFRSLVRFSNMSYLIVFVIVVGCTLDHL